MDIKTTLGNFFVVTDQKENEIFEVATQIMLYKNIPFVFYVEKTEDGYKISDHKLVCTFLSKIFDLNSEDVKQCIQEVLNINRVQLKKGEVFVTLNQEHNLNFFVSNFLVAVGQLIRMQVFFDKPEY
ncbi:MAG: DUF1828 domain-containing protein [Clostridia bacterium]|nr:DUF1828 domain-containing protein [Clostridia bacterium]